MPETDWGGQQLPSPHNSGDTTPIAPEFNRLLLAVAALREALPRPSTLGVRLLTALTASNARDLIGAGTSNLTEAQAVSAVGGKIWTGTQAQYDTISPIDGGTLYVVTG